MGIEEGLAPEAKARINIDKRLRAAGWEIQNKDSANLSANDGFVALREYPIDVSPENKGYADYLLFIAKQPVGVVEAKKEETILITSGAEDQSADYAKGTPKYSVKMTDEPLPFVYESTGIITHFTDNRDPFPRSREIFNFHQPSFLKADLKKSVKEGGSLRARLQTLPELKIEGLRTCQFKAITKLEESFAQNRPRALIQMATGSGKTFTAITFVYRLLKFAKAKRVLFLVDTKNLGEQAEQEFQAYTPNDDNRKFKELYSVQRLSSRFIDPSAQVCISTIQRMYSILQGVDLDESLEEENPAEGHLLRPPKPVSYNPVVPIEHFDFIVIDECHRSIYNLWMQVLDYYDAFLIGLTATPDSRTFGFFNENVVSEYTHEEAVADGVNVGYDVYTIETVVTQKGAKLKAKQYVEKRHRLTRKRRWQQQDEDEEYNAKKLDKDVVNPSQIRRIIKTAKEAVETEIFSQRKEVPKTLIFAKSDSHADDIIKIVREEYGQGNDFCKKVTYKQRDEKPSEVLQQFRNEYNPRIAVTVDMIATGTDVKAIECLLFMRDVKSKNYFEQMKGRGTRTFGYDDLRRVTPSATTPKTHFVVIDAIGVSKSLKTDSRPLDKKKNTSTEELLKNIAFGNTSEEILTSVASRLVRLSNAMDESQLQDFFELAESKSIHTVASELLAAYDEDKYEDKARLNNGLLPGQDPTNEQLEEAKEEIIESATKVFDSSDLRNFIVDVRKQIEQTIDSHNIDELIHKGFDSQAKAKAKELVQSFQDFLKDNKEEITALKIFYNQPHRRRELTLKMIRELSDKLQQPPLMLTSDRLWWAYREIYGDKVKSGGTQHMLTDMVALMRFENAEDQELRPFSETVNRNFKDWIFRYNQSGKKFTEEQMVWLRKIRDHVITSIHIGRDDLENIEQGGLAKVWHLFGEEIDELIEDLNQTLVA